MIGGLLALRSLEESKLPRAQRHLDLPGAATVTGGLAALILALTQLEPMLRGAPTILGGAAGFVVPLAVGILLLAIFAAIESRTAHPLVSLRLLRVPGIVRANIAAAGLPVGLGAMMFIATQYLQAIRGLTPWETGLTYLALALPVTVFSPVAARLLGWLGRRRTAALGFALQATGLLLFLTVGPDSSLLGTVLPAFAITGAGAPIAYIPVTGAAVEDVGDDSGLASGLYNTTQQVSNTIALAAMAAAVAIGSSAAESGGVATSVTVDGVRAGLRRRRCAGARCGRRLAVPPPGGSGDRLRRTGDHGTGPGAGTRQGRAVTRSRRPPRSVAATGTDRRPDGHWRANRRRAR